MRGSPSGVITVRRAGLWRAASGFLAAASLATPDAWAMLSPQAAPVGAPLPVVSAALALLILAVSLMRTSPTTLRRDGVAGSLFQPGAPAVLPLVCSLDVALDVALDLGAFLLRPLSRRDAAGRHRVRWVPALRRGLEREWHSFRCAAVYSPRPGAVRSGDSASRPS